MTEDQNLMSQEWKEEAVQAGMVASALPVMTDLSLCCRQLPGCLKVPVQCQSRGGVGMKAAGMWAWQGLGAVMREEC